MSGDLGMACHLYSAFRSVRRNLVHNGFVEMCRNRNWLARSGLSSAQLESARRPKLPTTSLTVTTADRRQALAYSDGQS